jgi:hypothetical protein
MIVVFDLGGPLAVYGLLRSQGTSAVTALVISGVLPALGIAVGALADRRLDFIGWSCWPVSWWARCWD